MPKGFWSAPGGWQGLPRDTPRPGLPGKPQCLKSLLCSRLLRFREGESAPFRGYAVGKGDPDHKMPLVVRSGPGCRHVYRERLPPFLEIFLENPNGILAGVMVLQGLGKDR